MVRKRVKSLLNEKDKIDAIYRIIFGILAVSAMLWLELFSCLVWVCNNFCLSQDASIPLSFMCGGYSEALTPSLSSYSPISLPGLPFENQDLQISRQLRLPVCVWIIRGRMCV
jgi:hypothetical protein